MRSKRVVAGIAVACMMAFCAARPAFAGLQIELVYIAKNPQPGYPIVAGSGDLQEIMKVAAENWKRVFRQGGGNYKLTIQYGWAPLVGRSLFGQERMITETGDPSRIRESCILFNNDPILGGGVDGVFADPTPRDNSEYLSYTAESLNMGDGWLNIGRVFSNPTGDAVDRVDLLQVAMHEIGHALGLDYSYSGFIRDVPGRIGLMRVRPPRPFAGFEFYIGNGPHIDNPGAFPLMVERPTPGHRQLISGADALALAQLSSFDRPDMSDPPSIDVNGDNANVPTSVVPSSATCNEHTPATNTGPW